MPISVACSRCGSKFKAPDSAAGRKTKCPKCGASLVVPAAEAPNILDAHPVDDDVGAAVPAQAPNLQKMKACPFCGEQILAVAKKCKHCGETIDGTPPVAVRDKARTESTAFQVHPNDEQQMIKTMECFGWNLLGTQEVKTVDSHLEQRGDTVYSVTNTERYVKLSFSRALDLPNIAVLRKLEQRFNSLSVPPRPSVNWALWGVLGVFSCGIGWAVGVILTILNAAPVKEWEEQAATIAEQRQQIRAEAQQY